MHVIVEDGSTEIRRRSVLRLMGLAAAGPIAADLIGGSSARAATVGMEVVQNGEPAAVVIVASSDPQIVSSASTLIEYVGKSTGAKLPKYSSVPLSGPHATWNRIFVGPSTAVVIPAVNELDEDGFVISAQRNQMVIAGPTPWGTRFGVYEFLERYVGVRWLLPGPDGEDVPIHHNLVVPLSTITDQPAMRMRVTSPFGNGATYNDADTGRLWAARARTRWTLQFHHNLWKALPVAVYGDPTKPETYRPDFFPIKGGKTYIPAKGVNIGWQPRFTADGVVDAVAAQIIAQLRAAPATTSYSLGVNDSGGYSEDEVDPTLLNTFGYPSASVPYYRFVNAVVEKVTVEFPDVTFGLLAYANVVDPPPFALHPNVVPFIAHDRAGWAGREFRRSDADLTRRWRSVAREVGWYDYLYGIPYCAPRFDLDSMSDAYRFAADAGVEHVYSELYPNWAEGAKAWIFTKLLWNPQVDVDDLLREWCERAAGPRGAGDLLAYHRIWQRVWNKEVPETTWFRTGAQEIYYIFSDAGYFDVITAEQAQTAKSHLDRAVNAAQTPAQKARVGLMRRAFEYHEASALSFPRRPVPARNADSALRLLDSTMDSLDQSVAMASKRYELIAEYKATPLLSHGNLEARRLGLNWSGWNLYALWDIARYIADDRPGADLVRDRVSTLASASENAGRFAAMLLAVADNEIRRLGVNTSFDQDTAPWLIETSLPTTKPMRLDASVNADGGTSLRIPLGFKGGGVSQEMAVTEGFFRSVMRYYTPRHAKSGTGMVMPVWYLYDSAGKVMYPARGRQQALADTRGQWAELVMSDMLPAGVAKIRCYCSLVSTQNSSDPLYLDAAEFIQLSTAL